MTSRWLPQFVLVAGALASVATSRVVSEWELDSEESLPPALLDETAPITYPLRIEIGGAGPYPLLYGTLSATVRLSTRTSPVLASSVAIRLRSTTNPEISTEVLWPPLGIDSDVVDLGLPAWTGCDDRPCAENFELVITPQSLEPLSVDITGSVVVSASAEGSDYAPEDATLGITIGPPQ